MLRKSVPTTISRSLNPPKKHFETKLEPSNWIELMVNRTDAQVNSFTVSFFAFLIVYFNRIRLGVRYCEIRD